MTDLVAAQSRQQAVVNIVYGGAQGHLWPFFTANVGSGDGDMDAVVLKFGDRNELWLHDGLGIFGAAHHQLVAAASSSVDLALADPDADGDLDLFVTSQGMET